MISADINSYAKDNWEQYLDSISTLSRPSHGEESLVTSDTKLYNFDKITEDLFACNDKPQSVDAICATSKSINLVEFKTGFKEKITKENFNYDSAKCDYIQALCSDYWDLFWQLRKKEKQLLLTSIREKAIESFITLEKKVLPNCEESRRKVKLKLIAVVDANADEAIENIFEELAGETSQHNQIEAIRQSLLRLSKYTDSNNDKYYFDEVQVMSSADFTNSLRVKGVLQDN